MLDDGFKLKCSVPLKKGRGKRKKLNDTGDIVVSSLWKLRQNVTSRGGWQRGLEPSLHDRPSKEIWPSRTEY